MPQTVASEIANLTTSFTAQVEQIIDAMVASRLQEVFSQLGASGTTVTFPRTVSGRPLPLKPVRQLRGPPRVVRPSSPPPRPLVELPKPKVATVIPPEVKITRLPPGPVPGRQRSYSEAGSQCRVPGCLDKNSGPRYDLMCRDHYARFNVEERAKFKSMWKATHAVA